MVVAAGSGRRFGADKLRARLGDRRVLDVAVAVAARATDGVVVVVHPDHLAAERSRLGTGDIGVPVKVVAGGETRSASVRAGLDVVPASSELVAVHDGARPLASEGLWRRVLAALAGSGDEGAEAPATASPDGVVPVVPVADTLRRVDGGVVDRAGLVAVQTPQAFRAPALRAAHAGEGEATDDAGLVEAAGGRIVQVAGEATNLKITTPDDLVVAAALWAGRAAGSPIGPDADSGVATPSATPGDTMTAHDRTMTPTRVGQGFDVHRRGDAGGRPLVLGGVVFPDEAGLVGHSDADVVAHACADALLGACGLPDIGQLFPDTDEAWAGADSIELLRRVAGEVRAAGFEPVNVDCAVVCDTPRIAPVRDEMSARLSAAVGAPVTVKGRRTEGLGALGRGDGIAAWAVASVGPRRTGDGS